MLALRFTKVTLDGTAVDPGLIKYAGLTPGSGGTVPDQSRIPEGTGNDPEIRGHGGQFDAPERGSNCR